MEKYSDRIQRLFKNGKLVNSHYETLVRGDEQALKSLLKALLSDPNDNIRETCAEILRDIGSAKSIPYLIKAISDKCLLVRQDAFWAIEHISGYRPSLLSQWLNIDFENNTDMKRKVIRWWKKNKIYIKSL